MNDADKLKAIEDANEAMMRLVKLEGIELFCPTRLDSVRLTDDAIIEVEVKE